MEQLRPKIRPKAPASLKKNVLKAVSQDGQLSCKQAGRSSRPAATWRIALAAAAVLLLGIMTFALWLNRDRRSSYESAPVLIAEKAGTKAVEETGKKPVKDVGEAASQKYAEPSAAVTTPTEAKSETTATAPLSAHQETTATTHSAQPTPPVLSHPAQQPTATKLLAESSATATSQAEQHTTPLPHREGQGVGLQEAGLQGAGLSPYERQLLNNFEAHRDLVNACLAEELAQVRFTQERIGQTTREYLQQYLDLQERITQQLREDIEDIAPEKNNPKEV